MTVLDTTDSRFAKALDLADQSGQWLRLRRDGRCVAVGIPSSQPGRYYRVTRTSCECEDWQRRQLACKHMQALEVAIVRQAEKPRPATDVVEGLAAMVRDRYAEIFEPFYGDDVADAARGFKEA